MRWLRGSAEGRVQCMSDSVSDQNLESLLSVFDYPFTLIDVGAGGGINRRRWGRFRNLKVIGFEPDEREFKKLRDCEGSRWFQVALYGAEGVFDLNVTRYQTNTSLLEPNLEFLKGLHVTSCRPTPFTLNQPPVWSKTSRRPA